MSARLSLYEYRESRQVVACGHSFYALLAATMWQADTYNSARLREAFPDVWADLDARYNAPGGLLESERGDG